MMMTPNLESFLCQIDDVQQRIAGIDPQAYAKSRNYLDGAVTWLSPFVTHGITHTREIAEMVLQERKPSECYKLLYELGWREYFHRTWQRERHHIFEDLRGPQTAVASDQIPASVIFANTGIAAVDLALQRLYAEGLMHNHARMWVAAMVCNMARSQWQPAAQFLHYHLLDGDLASNTLSWQWIAGTFSHKRYLANQDNINQYSRTQQRDTWLDKPYDAISQAPVPDALKDRATVKFDRQLIGEPVHPLTGKVALRSMWQLDPRWQSHIDTQLVFIDTAWLSRWPLSPNRKRFISHWASLCNASVVYGTVTELIAALRQADVTRQEYPACMDWPGQVVDRPWLYPIPNKSFTSFSQYFKQVKKSIGL